MRAVLRGSNSLFPALLLVVTALLVGCAGGSASQRVAESDPEAAAAVEKFFLSFRQAVQAGNSEAVLQGLSTRTQEWLQDMRYSARAEKADRLRERPFFEVLTVVALRVEQRLNPAFIPTPMSILEKAVMHNSTVKSSILKGGLGNYHVFGNSAELGFAKADRVPVFHFVNERGGWKLDLYRTFPLILQGAESLARSKESDPIRQAVYLLEQFGGVRVRAEDLH